MTSSTIESIAQRTKLARNLDPRNKCHKEIYRNLIGCESDISWVESDGTKDSFYNLLPLLAITATGVD